MPGPALDLPACDAVVVALKTRTVPAGDAVAATVRVRQWLPERGVQRLYFLSARMTRSQFTYALASTS
jgi:uncharacterized protein YgbK (DUF1537 family)